MKALLALLLAAGMVAACSMGEDPTYPLPTSPITWPLPTQPVAGPTACPATVLTPVKIEWDATHRSLSLGGQKATLPNGFSARMLPTGRLEILAPDGTVAARDGDTIALGGSDYAHVCRVQGVEY
jgi:hypothetical protein